MKLLWLLLTVLFSPTISLAQKNDTNTGQEPLSILDDKNYLETIQTELEGKVSEAREEMIEKAKSIEAVTRQYAKAKITQNLVKALRVLLEKEMKRIPMKDRIRQPRQEEEDNQETGGQDEEGQETSGTSGNENQQPQQPQSQPRPSTTGDKDESNPNSGGTNQGNKEKTSTVKSTGGGAVTTDATETTEGEVTESSGSETGGGSGGGEEEEDRVEATTGPGGSIPLESTSLFGSIANVLKSIVGGQNGTKPLNLTYTLNYASDLILRPLGNFKPFQGVGTLLGLSKPAVPEPVTKKPKPKIQYIPVYITIPPEPTDAPTQPTRKYPHRPLIGAFVGRSLFRDDVNGTEETTVSIQPETEAPVPTESAPPIQTEIPLTADTETAVETKTSPKPLHFEVEEILPVPEVTSQSIIYPGGSIRSPAKIPVAVASDPFRPVASVFAEPIPSSSPPPVQVEPEPEVVQTDVPISVTTILPATVVTETSQQPAISQEPDIDSEEFEEEETEAPPPTTKKPKPVRTKPTTTTTTTTPKPEPGVIYIDNFAEDVQKGIDGIIKNIPDILKSAQQALGLLQGLRGLFGGGGDDSEDS